LWLGSETVPAEHPTFPAAPGRHEFAVEHLFRVR
jgi:hypothetical protein